jgi:hypothetical protein
MEQGLEQKHRDEEVERQEQRSGNGKMLRNGAVDLRKEQNDKERHRND